METTQEFIRALRERGGSDTRAAPLLGVSQNTFTEWRNGTALPSDEHAIKIAELLQLDPAFVLAIINGERAKSKLARAAWQRVAAQFGKAATVAALAIGAASFGMPAPTQANFTIHGLKPEEYSKPF